MEKAESVDKYIGVLDHGFVALKDYMGGDEAVEQAARVSYGAGTRSTSDTRALLRTLMRSRHSTPFESTILKFHMKLPIFVARQLVRHRTQSLNEYSMRYSLAPMQFYIPELDNFQKQSKTNKQGRVEPVATEVYTRISAIWKQLQEDAAGLYTEAILDDVARELARIHLPLNLYTEWFATMNLHNLFHYLGLRSDPHAQWEAQQYSNVMGGFAKLVAPLSFEAWVDYQFCGTRLSRLEWNALRNMLHNVHGSGWDWLRGAVANGILSKREREEFLAKFSSSEPVAIPNFDLDLSTAKTGDHFFQLAQAAVPEALRT